jgi:hypothetical protein
MLKSPKPSSRELAGSASVSGLVSRGKLQIVTWCRAEPGMALTHETKATQMNSGPFLFAPFVPFAVNLLPAFPFPFPHFPKLL